MEYVKLEAFEVIGISVRTTNENNKSGKDIAELWAKFMKEGILENIPKKIDNNIYSIYTEYESDYLKPYTTILACRVKTLDHIPEGMIGIEINKGNYVKFTAQGDLTKGVIFKKWTEIWQTDLNRAYSADFEVYSEKDQNPRHAEVDIYVAINK